MGRQLAGFSTFAALLISLFIVGCQSGARNSGVPSTQGGDTTFDPTYTGGSGGGGATLPTLDGTVPDAGGTGSTLIPGITPDEGNNGGLNAGDTSSVLQALSGQLNSIGSFDPRSVPQVAQQSYNNFMCAMAQANLIRAASGQFSLPDYVASMYVNLLRRAPESAGVVGHHAQVFLNAGPRAMVVGFIKSDEHLNNSIRAAFRYFLNRAPTDSQLNSWRSWLKNWQDTSGNSYNLERFHANLMGGTEFFQNVSKNSARAQVINNYRYLLGRVPAESEIQHWMGKYNTMSRTSMSLKFTESTEYRRKKVAQLTRLYLARHPTAGELDFRVNQMANGDNTLRMMVNLLTDPEYVRRTATLWEPFIQYALSGQCNQ